MGLVGGEEAVAGLPPALEVARHGSGEASSSSSDAAREVAQSGDPRREGCPEGGWVAWVAAARPLRRGTGGASVL